MPVLDRLKAMFMGAPAAPRPKRAAFFADPRRHVGASLVGGHSWFDGASRDRLLGDFTPPSLGPNRMHADASLLRARARNLVDNEPLATSAVESYVSNVIECGIRPRPLIEAPLRRVWTDHWSRGWGQSEADLSAAQTIDELSALWLEEVIVGGGCILHRVTLPPSRARRRKLPLALELIPEERIVDAGMDGLPIPRRSQKSAPDYVRGVEVDPATGAALAYWIYPADQFELNGRAADPIRLPAEDCHYAFFKRRIGRLRGYTLLAPAIVHLWKLGYYLDNEMTAAAISSCFALVIEGDNADTGLGLTGDENESLLDTRGNPIEQIEPGMIARLPSGKLNPVAPNRPNSTAEVWVKLIERSISIAVGLSRQETTRDISDANFSATRAAANADRRRFRRMQRFTVNHFSLPAWRWFVEAASLRGLEGFPGPADLVANYDEWTACNWQTPGWQSVNPKEDAQAAEIEIPLGLSTRADYAAARGRDWDDTAEQLAHEEDTADALDIEISGGSASDSTAEPAPQEGI